MPNTWNEYVYLLRPRGMNLYLYWEYAEWISTYSENIQNETNLRTDLAVRVRRTHKMNLSVYWEYADQIHMSTVILRMHEIKYISKFESKNENT